MTLNKHSNLGIKTYFNWSSGKDSTLALHYLKNDDSLNIDRLLTTVNRHYDRVSMHGLRREVLAVQAKALGISLDVLEVPENPSMEEYNKLMHEKIDALKSSGYQKTVFGDIFLEDLRNYRDQMLTPYGIETVYPLWKKDTATLLREFIALGYQAVVVCINTSILDKSFLGRKLDEGFLKDLPSDIDPCGENGEFHTFCFDGPIFNYPVNCELGEKVFRGYPDPSDDDKEIVFGFCDIEISSD